MTNVGGIWLILVSASNILEMLPVIGIVEMSSDKMYSPSNTMYPNVSHPVYYPVVVFEQLNILDYQLPDMIATKISI